MSISADVLTSYKKIDEAAADALLAKEMRVGDRIALNGRIQSRVYRKTDPEGSEREMTAYEVSVMSMRREEPAQE